MLGGIIIRKINLTMDENKKYEVIKRLVDDNGNKKRRTENFFHPSNFIYYIEHVLFHWS